MTPIDSSDHAVKLLKSRAKVIDEDGNELKTGEIGEVISKSELNMKGYLNKPDATENQ